MKSILKYILIAHIMTTVLVSSTSLYAVTYCLDGSFSELFLLGLRFFWGIFFLGILVFGLGDALRVGLAISMKLVRGSDFNDNEFRGQLQGFIAFVAEIYIALLGLFVTRIVGIAWFP
jgi:hypothetical protein